MKAKEKFLKWWWFTVKNPVVRKGEHGGFKWCFRRFWLDISTLSGNFQCRFMADEHPYGYLLAGKDDENIKGFVNTLYEIGKLLTTDQGFVNDIQKAIKKYSQRLDKQAAKAVVEDETEEKIALEGEKEVQEYISLPKRYRKRADRDIDNRFKKAVKEAEKGDLA